MTTIAAYHPDLVALPPQSSVESPTTKTASEGGGGRSSSLSLSSLFSAEETAHVLHRWDVQHTRTQFLQEFGARFRLRNFPGDEQFSPTEYVSRVIVCIRGVTQSQTLICARACKLIHSTKRIQRWIRRWIASQAEQKRQILQYWLEADNGRRKQAHSKMYRDCRMLLPGQGKHSIEAYTKLQVVEDDRRKAIQRLYDTRRKTFRKNYHAWFVSFNSAEIEFQKLKQRATTEHRRKQSYAFTAPTVSAIALKKLQEAQPKFTFNSENLSIAELQSSVNKVRSSFCSSLGSSYSEVGNIGGSPPQSPVNGSLPRLANSNASGSAKSSMGILTTEATPPPQHGGLDGGSGAKAEDNTKRVGLGSSSQNPEFVPRTLAGATVGQLKTLTVSPKWDGSDHNGLVLRGSSNPRKLSSLSLNSDSSSSPSPFASISAPCSRSSSMEFATNSPALLGANLTQPNTPVATRNAARLTPIRIDSKDSELPRDTSKSTLSPIGSPELEWATSPCSISIELLEEIGSVRATPTPKPLSPVQDVMTTSTASNAERSALFFSTMPSVGLRTSQSETSLSALLKPGSPSMGVRKSLIAQLSSIDPAPTTGAANHRGSFSPPRRTMLLSSVQSDVQRGSDRSSFQLPNRSTTLFTRRSRAGPLRVVLSSTPAEPGREGEEAEAEASPKLPSNSRLSSTPSHATQIRPVVRPHAASLSSTPKSFSRKFSPPRAANAF